MLPSQYLNLDRKEKAVIIGFIQIKAESDKKEAKKINSKSRTKR